MQPHLVYLANSSGPKVGITTADGALTRWLDQGASPTDTTKSLLKRAGVFGPAPTVTETVVGNVREAAKKAGGKVRAAAAGAGAAVAGVVDALGVDAGQPLGTCRVRDRGADLDAFDARE